jgi:hypothetical protein
MRVRALRAVLGISATLAVCGAAATTASSAPTPTLLPAAARQGDLSWTPVVALGGSTAVELERTSGVTLLRFDQSLVTLALHAGSGDPGGSGWRYGPAVVGAEYHRLIAAFNGGFKLSVGAGGFQAQGRTASPLLNGGASIVTYADGYTDIGAWHRQVPQAHRAIASVRQDLQLLVDGGRAASSVNGCIEGCWGATLGGVLAVARSALGIDSSGHLVWAAGESLLPSTLAQALVAAGVQRAVQLDINPEWVAGYLYRHRPRHAVAIQPMVPGQSGIPGFFLAPYSRDFFTVLAR